MTRVRVRHALCAADTAGLLRERRRARLGEPVLAANSISFWLVQTPAWYGCDQARAGKAQLRHGEPVLAAVVSVGVASDVGSCPRSQSVPRGARGRHRPA